MAVPDTEQEQQDFIIEQEQPVSSIVPESPVTESSQETSDDDFDLSDISHKKKSREDIIAEAEAAAFAE